MPAIPSTAVVSAPPSEVRSTCPYCGVGCGVLVAHDGTTITGVRGDPAHPANAGRLCSKGSTLHLTATRVLQSQVRASTPMRRVDRSRPLTTTDWNSALDEVAARFAAIVTSHGPDAVGFYLSGQLLTEDYHAFNKLAKGLVFTNNVDTNSRLCMSSAVAGYKAAFGADSVPACYDDLEFADTVFIAGSNMAWAHPVLYRRLEDARRARPHAKVIVVDPRRTETAADADLHLQILPGTDVVLFHAMLHVMLWEDLVDADYIRSHTNGFAELRDRVRAFTPEHAAQTCGLRAQDIVTAARWFANVGADGVRRPTLSLWCQGLNQSSSGTDKNTALLNLHLATGQIGREGAGPLSLTGQPNAMGGREVGGLAHLLPGHRLVSDAQHRAEVAALWGVRELPAAPGKAALQMFEAAAEGEIRALWIVCTNPAQSLPDQALVRRALQRCEFVVVQDAYATAETLAFADLLLPAAGWGEKGGTVTNSERRISRVNAAVAPCGEARADWEIAAAVGRRLETCLPPRRIPSLQGQSMFAWTEPESVWLEHRDATRGRDLDITGLDYARLEQPRQWPFPKGATSGPARLFTDGVFGHDDGRARFHAPAWRPIAEACDARFPIALTTGRLRDQWHGMSRTGTLGRLFAHAPSPVIEMAHQDLARRRLVDGDLVRISSRRGVLVLPVQASDSVAPAQAFVAMHWGQAWLGGRNAPGVNALTSPAHCPTSLQPEFKHAAIRIEPAGFDWQLQAAVWLPADRALRVREALHAPNSAFAYASCIPFGRDVDGRIGLALRAANETAVGSSVLDVITRLIGLDAAHALRYRDTAAGAMRIVRLDDAGRIDGWLLGGDCTAATWLRTWLERGVDASAIGMRLLAGGATAPATATSDARARGPIVCSCNDVSEREIEAALDGCVADEAAARIAFVQSRTACGTTCGSCVPALKTLVKSISISIDSAPEHDHA